MPRVVPTKFTEYEFTPAEMYAATRFSDLSLQLVQTLAAKAAVEKVHLTVDPQNPQKFVQQEAVLTGQIEAYENILALAEATPQPEPAGTPVPQPTF